MTLKYQWLSPIFYLLYKCPAPHPISHSIHSNRMRCASIILQPTTTIHHRPHTNSLLTYNQGLLSSDWLACSYETTTKELIAICCNTQRYQELSKKNLDFKKFSYESIWINVVFNGFWECHLGSFLITPVFINYNNFLKPIFKYPDNLCTVIIFTYSE